MKVIAHRGNDNNENNNRMEGLLDCLEKDYIDGVEFDVVMTKDYKFILSHDYILKTKTSFYNVKKETLKFLKSKEFIKNGKVYPIVELKEFLDKINSNKILLMEFKIDENEKIFAKKIKPIIKKYKNLNLWICSFDSNVLKFFEEYKIGLIKTRIINQHKSGNYNFISINYIQKQKLPYFIWTINHRIKLPNDKNFLGIITDKPRLFKGLKLDLKKN